jgi:hypothetical protein
MEILKPFFGRRSDGAWRIESMRGIPLKAAGETDANFYSVDNNIFLADLPHVGTIKSLMGQSIVPIVAKVIGENSFRCLGTGFFISCTGLLITAAHVITDPIDRKYGDVTKFNDLTYHARRLNLGVMVPTNPLFQVPGFRFFVIEWASFLAEHSNNPLPFQGVDLKLASDIAICKVAPIEGGAPHQPLAIVQSGLIGTGMAVGKTATAVGYSGMNDVTLSQVADGVVSGDFEFHLHVSKGEILERYPDNMETKSTSTPGPCFSASAKYAPGMSGSPIFDDERIYVHGVVSKGWEDEDGLMEFGSGSMLAPSMGLAIEQLEGKSLIELLAAGGEGMPKLSIPDS